MPEGFGASIRCWVSDVAGVFDPDYVWHDLAQQWQTAGVVETVATEFAAMPLAERAGVLSAGGMDANVAARVAEGIDVAMGRCILALYRSAGL